MMLMYTGVSQSGQYRPWPLGDRAIQGADESYKLY